MTIKRNVQLSVVVGALFSVLLSLVSLGDEVPPIELLKELKLGEGIELTDTEDPYIEIYKKLRQVSEIDGAKIDLTNFVVAWHSDVKKEKLRLSGEKTFFDAFETISEAQGARLVVFDWGLMAVRGQGGTKEGQMCTVRGLERKDEKNEINELLATWIRRDFHFTFRDTTPNDFKESTIEMLNVWIDRTQLESRNQKYRPISVDPPLSFADAGEVAKPELFNFAGYWSARKFMTAFCVFSEVRWELNQANVLTLKSSGREKSVD